MDLIACSGTQTVRIVLSELPVDESAFLRTEPPGSLAHNDANGVLYQTPLLVGCVRACLKTILNAPTVESYLKARCEERTSQLLERVRKAFTESTPEEGRQLRAELGDFAVRLARLNVMACGGAALATGHPAERLYREALLYSLMAQTAAIVHQAFEEVFP
jgi:hypothetical protein